MSDYEPARDYRHVLRSRLDDAARYIEKACANPECEDGAFLTLLSWQKYCSPECRNHHRHLLKAAPLAVPELEGVA
jgi:hypothetical protein